MNKITSPSERVFEDDSVPETTGSEIKVYAARNEFEPFQLIVEPASSGNVVVEIGDFGSGIKVEIYQVNYVEILQTTDALGRTGPYPDPLWPLSRGDTVSITAGENTSLWFSVSVAATVSPGDYTTTIQIAGQVLAGNDITVDVTADINGDGDIGLAEAVFIATCSRRF